jgi:hypothetical protein
MPDDAQTCRTLLTWRVRAGRQNKGGGSYLGQMSPAIRMTISFVPVQDHDNKSGSEMMLRVTILRGIIYVLGRSRSSILHHYQTLLIYDKSLNIRHMSYINFKKCRKLTP